MSAPTLPESIDLLSGVVTGIAKSMVTREDMNSLSASVAACATRDDLASLATVDFVDASMEAMGARVDALKSQQKWVAMLGASIGASITIVVISVFGILQ